MADSTDGDFEGFYTPPEALERALAPGTAGELWLIRHTGLLPNDIDIVSDEIRDARLAAQAEHTTTRKVQLRPPAVDLVAGSLTEDEPAGPQTS
jgi:hypothetical protein